MIDINPLNPQVARELKANLELWLIFAARFGGYDWEIDPLHRQAWVEDAKQREAQLLEDAKAVLKRLKGFHTELKEVSLEVCPSGCYLIPERRP